MNTNEENAVNFIRESNRIEGILREPTKSEIEAHLEFMKLEKVTISDLLKFAMVVEPGGVALRDHVSIRTPAVKTVDSTAHPYPLSSPEIRDKLQSLLARVERNWASAFATHQYFEHLHPFTEGNGVAGRMLWMWQVRNLAPGYGFLHTWYYQTLQNSTGLDSLKRTLSE